VRLEAILTRLFGPPEEINGNHRCPTYLYRWRVWGGSTRYGHKTGRAIYVHHFVGNDWSRDMHDHPKRFISIGLAGSYIEETPDGTHRFRAPWIRTFPATHIHRILTPMINGRRSCWTLLIVLKVKREWGFWHDGTWIAWDRYVGGENGIADKMKDCA
jgi:hypothetical protein